MGAVMEPAKPQPMLIDMMSNERHVMVGDSFTIGRSPDADLVLDSKRVSRQHAMIRREGSGFLLFDLKSSNGSWVDGREVEKPVALGDGSHIRIGSYGFTFYTGADKAVAVTASLPPDATMVLIDREPMVFLVADIHSFTTFSEGRDEEQVAVMLSPWYDRCRKLVQDAGGTVDKFIGDSVFAYWRKVTPESCAAACECAEATVRSLEGLDGFDGGKVGAALHVGDAAVGAIGGGSRTALGEAVNLTFRVEGLTRPLGERMLATGAFLENAGDELGARFRSLGEQEAKGFKKRVEVFGLVGE